MKLQVMTATEYELWFPRSQRNYIEDKRRANGLTQVEAEKVMDADFRRFLPKGLASPDNFLFTAKNELNEIVGFLWLILRGAEGNRAAFVCDIIVEERFRRQGMGRRIMQLAEVEAKVRGANRIGLHVFAFNKAAISLYRSLCYEVTDLVMEKPLI